MTNVNAIPEELQPYVNLIARVHAIEIGLNEIKEDVGKIIIAKYGEQAKRYMSVMHDISEELKNEL